MIRFGEIEDGALEFSSPAPAGRKVPASPVEDTTQASTSTASAEREARVA
jgi:hypothetical protein